MRKLVPRLLCFCLLQLAIGALVFPPAFTVRREGLMAALEDKVALLDEDGPPRLILVGGSNVSFGIDSETFRETLNRPTINAGLHYGLGLDFYLQMMQQHARPGDVVVLLPEYDMLQGGLHIKSADFTRRLLRVCPSAFRYLSGNLKNVKGFADQLALSEIAHWTQTGFEQDKHYLGDAWEALLGGDPDQRRQARRDEEESRRQALARQWLMCRANFNEHGDLIGHHGRPPERPLKGMGRFVVHARGVERSVARLNRFARHCREQGVTVWLAYPPMPESRYGVSRAELEKLHGLLCTSLEIPVLNRPEDSVFAEENFFNTANHLTEAGKYMRSRELASQLGTEYMVAQPMPDQVLR